MFYLKGIHCLLLLDLAPDKLVLPTDVVVADKFAADSPHDTVVVDAIPQGRMALDIGADSIAHFKSVLADAKLVVWNGPMGVTEMDAFAKGTEGVGLALADLVDGGAEVIIGGGDSAAAVKKLGLDDKMSHVSTGGGASLELLEGKVLPGIAVLDDK